MSRLFAAGRRPDLVDYLTRGVVEGLDPHILFDAEYYGDQRRDLKAAFASGLNPLVHWREFGWAERLDPHPLFDTAFYLDRCPAALQPAGDPLAHFLEVGWRYGIDPHPLFSITYYREKSPDIAAAGINPLLHFLRSGLDEGRPTTPWFDRDYYLETYPDVAGSHWSPFMHYVRQGLAEGRCGSHLLAYRKTHLVPEFRDWSALDVIRRDAESYHAWVRSSRFAIPATEAAERGLPKVVGHQPVVSMLLTVTEGARSFPEAALQCMRAQSYAAWQLCVAIDDNADAGTVGRLRAVAAEDARITLFLRGTSGHEARGLDALLDTARGEFVGFLGAHDRLHRLALATLVPVLLANPECDLVYADEDTIDAGGFHVLPVFKPDWSPELLVGQDLLTRSGLFRTRLVREIGFEPGFEGASAYEMSLRFAERLDPRTALHVARPLYHRAAFTPSDAMERQRADAMYRAIHERGHRHGLHPVIVRGSGERFRTAYTPLSGPGSAALVSVVIPTANASFDGPLGRERVLDNCVGSLVESTDYKRLEIIVVHDGNLLEAQVKWLEARGVTLVAYAERVFNFSQKVNVGVRASRGEYVCILNDDVQAKKPDWLSALLGYAEQPGIGVVGAKLFFPDGRLQHTGIVVQDGNPGHLYYRASGDDAGYLELNDTPRNLLAVTGACQVLRRSVFDRVGGYDEDLPLNFNDVDFCLRIIDAGLRVVYVPQAELYHFEGISKIIKVGNQLTTPTETDFFQARWRTRYPLDPFYSPHLPPYEPLGLREPDEVRRTPSQMLKLPAKELKRARGQGVNFLGPTNRSSGLGTASRGYVAALQLAGVETRLVTLDKIFGHQGEVAHELESARQDFPIAIVQANADTTDILFEHYGGELERAQFRIGLWVWELPAAPGAWHKAAARYDELWVPTTFCQSAFAAISPVDVAVVPYALPSLPEFGAAERVATRDAFDIPRDAFVFMYMFDTFSYVDRKNPACLLEAFEREFAGRDDVVLCLKMSYPNNLKAGYSPGDRDFMLRLRHLLARMPNIRVISDIVPSAQLYGLIDAIDCYVSPHRSEGFGLTVAEAMYYGKVVIATDFGGTTDFVNEATGLPLRYTLVELEADIGPYRRGNVWADASVEHLQELMRRVIGDAGLCGSLGRAAQAFVRERFMPAPVGALARKRLRSIVAQL